MGLPLIALLTFAKDAEVFAYSDITGSGYGFYVTAGHYQIADSGLIFECLDRANSEGNLFLKKIKGAYDLNESFSELGRALERSSGLAREFIKAANSSL